MKNNNQEEINYLDIVQNEWREAYDREWGLGIVLSVVNDDHCWVGKIEKDEDGYFLTNQADYRHVSSLMKTDKQTTEVSIKIKTKEE